MKAYPLRSITLEEAIQKQFELVEIITKNLKGDEFLAIGDLGVQKDNNMPVRTRIVEKILAEFFEAEDAILVRGSGTNALRLCFFDLCSKTNKILVHDAPIYKTSEVSLNAMKLDILKYNFNDTSNLEEYISCNNVKVVLLQHTRQKLDDKYNLEEIINKIKNIDNNIKIIVDDNYAILKTNKNGIQMGADVSAFSLFKLQGPVGVGLILGKKEIISRIRKMNYSGGSQVQGYEAMKVLRGLVVSPVLFAIQSREVENLERILLDKNRFGYIENVLIANAQSKVILVEFKEEIAKEILKYTCEFGALSHPVGAESEYEICPLIYRVSSSFIESNNQLENKMIRVNPNRASALNISNIIEKAYNKVKENRKCF